MKKFVLFFIALMLFLPPGARAANPVSVTKDSLATLIGAVKDKNFRKSSVPHAVIKVKYGRDSVFYQTGQSGSFKIENLPPVEVIISVSHMSFKPYVAKLTLEPGENVFVPELETDIKQIMEAYAVGKADLMTKRGDTLIFNAAALSKQEGDDLAQLLEQIPGMKLEKGKIYYQGEQIKRAYINGKMIFGDNPMDAANHLAAEEVRNVKVFDEQSVEGRRKGWKTSKKERVMNVTTKTKMTSAYDLNANASAGADANTDAQGRLKPRYSLDAGANFFSEELTGSVSGSINNLGVSGPVLGAPPGPIRKDGKDVLAFAHIEKHWQDRLLGSSLDVRYQYSRNEYNSNTRTVTDYLPTASNPEMHERDSSGNYSSNYSHIISAVSFINVGKLRNLFYSGFFQFDGNNSFSRSGSCNRPLEGPVTMRDEQNTDNGRDWSTTHSLKWSGEGAGNSVAPTVVADFGYSHRNGDANTVDTLAFSTVQRDLRKTLQSDNLNASGEAGIKKNFINNESTLFGAELAYYVRYSKDLNQQLSLNVFEYSRTDTSNTYNHHYESFAHGPKLSCDFSHGKMHLSAWANFDFDKVSYADEFRPEHGSVSKLYFAPSAVFHANLYGVNIQYSMRTSLPDVKNLQGRIEDANPLSLTAGNPLLVPYMNHSLNVGFYTVPMKKSGSNFAFSLMGNLSNNPVVSRYEYFSSDTVLPEYDNYRVPAGAMLWRSVNAGTQFDLSASASFNQRIQNIKSSISYTLSGRYSSTPQFISEDLCYLNSFTPAFDLLFNGELWKNSRVFLSNRTAFSMDDNTMGEKVTRRMIESVKVTLTQQFPLSFRASVTYDMNMTKFLGTAGVDNTTHFLGATVGKRFLKGALGISLSVQDALSRGSAYSVLSSNNYVRQTWNPTYGRYYLLSVSYRFRQGNARPQHSVIFGH